MYGNSHTAKRFGARIDVSMPGDGLFLVRFRNGGTRDCLDRAGGRVVYEAGSSAVLALLPLNGYFLLKNDRAVAFIGPVALDRERYARVMSLVGRARLTQPQE